MEVINAVEMRRPVRETPLQRLGREFRQFCAALLRVVALAAIFLPILIIAFFTADIPVRLIDHFFDNPAARPGLWLRQGYAVLALAPLVAILIARRYGGDEASRVITASWAVAVAAVFAQVSYIAPLLDEADIPRRPYVIGFVGSAIMGQFIAAGLYDLMRGGGAWWRAPLYAALAAYGASSLLYFPVVYWGRPEPWLNWMIADLGLKAAAAFLFVGVYGLLRRRLKPRRGFGG